jgi:MarR family transcriptional regulator, 2-MHQ and catechol-resistance regulon repressor
VQRTAKAVAAGTPEPRSSADAALDADALALHRVVSDLVRMFQFRDRDRICCHDVSVTQCYALEALAARGELTLNQLAAELYLDKSTTSRVVDALVSKGYAERRPHPLDGRALQLVVTRSGRRLYEKIDDELLAEVRGVVAGFSPAVRQSMAAMLQRLLRAAAPRLMGDAAGAACCAGDGEVTCVAD